MSCSQTLVFTAKGAIPREGTDNSEGNDPSKGKLHSDR